MSVAVLVALVVVLYDRNRAMAAHSSSLVTRYPGWAFSAIATPLVVLLLSIGVALDVARQRTVERVNQTILALEHLTASLITPAPIDAFVNELARRVRRALGADYAAIYLRGDLSTSAVTGRGLVRRAADGAGPTPDTLPIASLAGHTTIPLGLYPHELGAIVVRFPPRKSMPAEVLRTLRFAAQPPAHRAARAGRAVLGGAGMNETTTTKREVRAS